MQVITSAENAHYKALLKLAHSSRERRKAGLSLLDGIHLIEAFHDAGGRPELVAVSESGTGDAEIQTLLRELSLTSTLLLSDVLFRQLSPVESPTGILAAVRTPQPDSIPTGKVSCVLLENIQDPGNLGSILRSAAGAGFRHVVLSKGTVHAWSPRVLRAGMGAHFMLSIHEHVDLLGFSRSFNGRVIATSHQGGTCVFDGMLTGTIALIFGNEGSGVSPALRSLADDLIAIPMPGKVESLNVAAAAAVCLFERVRQLHAGAGAIESMNHPKAEN